ncbi:hypothetical protein pb186bvf_015537 [Paramecium bursaria]
MIMIHSRRPVTRDQMKLPFEVTKIKLQQKPKDKFSQILKTEQGTDTSEDFEITQPQVLTYQLISDLMAAFSQRLNFIDSPFDYQLPTYANKEIILNVINIENCTYEKYQGRISLDGYITSSQEKLFQSHQSRLLHIQLKGSIKCLYLCIIQGVQSHEKVKRLFIKFIQYIRQAEYLLLKPCLACALEQSQILVWNSNQIIWYFNESIVHNKKCKAQLKHSQQLRVEDLNPVLEFIKPSPSQVGNRLNQIITQVYKPLRPKSCVERKKIASQIFTPKHYF